MRWRRFWFGLLGLVLAACDDPAPAWHAEVGASDLTLDRLAEIVGELLEARVEGCEVERGAEDRLQVRLADGRLVPLYLLALFEAESAVRVARIETRLSWFVDHVAPQEK